jgi:hypothetical protein
MARLERHMLKMRSMSEGRYKSIFHDDSSNVI